MPKSRGRRRKHNRPAAGGSRRSLAELKARALTELPILQATDEAEARGDAMAALRLMERHWQSRGDANFWRPERVERLTQLAALAPLPGWATSRWILAQAAQCLDGPMRDRVLKAMDIAVGARGGEAALVGVDEHDARAKVLDHDWLFRQVLLYELGGLQHFIRRVASPDLLAGADQIQGWARAPMGAFRLVRESTRTITWSDLSTGREVESLNLGAASLLEPGECAIGRLVPAERGEMFDSAPLVVPAAVAQQVAADPPGWVAVVCAACREAGPAGERVHTAGHDFRLLTDVPRLVQDVVTLDAIEAITGTRPFPESFTDLTALQVDLLRAAMAGGLAGARLPCSPWPSVAASLLQPRVAIALTRSLRASDAPKLSRLAGLVADPAGDICRALANHLESAA